MSSGGDDIVLSVNITGDAPTDEGTSSSGGGADEGMVKDPEFAKWAQSNDVSAAESIIARRLRWLPFVSAETSANLAEGLVAGYYTGNAEAGALAGGMLTDSTAGQVGGFIGGTARGAGSAASAALGSSFGPLIIAAGGAAASLLVMTSASKGFTRAMDSLARSIEGSAVLMSLQARQKTQIQMQREIRAMSMAPELSSLVASQTQRQIEMEELTGSISLGFARVLQPFHEYLTTILSILSDTLGPGIELLGDLLQKSLWLVTLQAKFYNWLWNWIKERFGLGSDDTPAGEYWMKALDPMSDANQPVGPDEVDAGILNPRGGKLNR